MPWVARKRVQVYWIQDSYNIFLIYHRYLFVNATDNAWALAGGVRGCSCTPGI